MFQDFNTLKYFSDFLYFCLFFQISRAKPQRQQLLQGVDLPFSFFCGKNNGKPGRITEFHQNLPAHAAGRAQFQTSCLSSAYDAKGRKFPLPLADRLEHRSALRAVPGLSPIHI